MKFIIIALVTLGLSLSALDVSAKTEADVVTRLPTWADLMQALEPIGDEAAKNLIDPNDEQSRQDLFRFMHELMSQAYFALQYQDPKYPDFWPMFNMIFAYGFANPDDSYYQSAIEGSGVYRLTGTRGTTRIVDFEVGSGMFVPYGKGEFGATLAHYDIDRDAAVQPDGSFEIILSAKRPKGWQGDWWELGDAATFLWVRQRSYDWVNETDGRFAIERIDVSVQKPRRSAEELAAALRQLPKWTARWVSWLPNYFVKGPYEKGVVNKVKTIDLGSMGGINEQRYLQGVFDIQSDEALILETKIPKECRYWSFHLADEFTDTLDWMNRQSQINGHTARLDTDGKFRVVISAQDPGVPNWLDVVEHKRGMIVGRWKECSSYPQPTIIKVNINEVRKNLPSDTPVVAIEQREASIRERRRAAQMRRRW